MNSIMIATHTLACIIALFVGAAIVLRKKGTKSHRLLGRLFVIAMGIGTLSSLGILSDGGYSVLHILSLHATYNLIKGLWLVKTKPQNWLFRHAESMGGAYIALIIAGFGVLGRHGFQGTGISWWWFLGFGFIAGMVPYVFIMRRLKKSVFDSGV